MASFIVISTIDRMEEILRKSDQPLDKTFGPYPDKEVAEETLATKGWKRHSVIGWHAPHLETTEKPYIFARVVEMSDIIQNTEEFPEA